MPIVSKSWRIVVLLAIALAASIVVPAAANATLAFNTNPSDPEVWVSAAEDGTEARYAGKGWVAQVSPDGELVAYEHEAAFTGWKLMIYDVATGKRHVRLTHMQTTAENIVGERTAFAWSPDSTTVAAVQNDPRSEKRTLYVIGVKGGKSKTRIASGEFRGVSFSPDGKEVVFGLAHTRGAFPKTDIARASVGGGPITLLTHDHISGWPLWGPRGQIAFSTRSKAERWKWHGLARTSELFDLFVMKANGGRVKRLTTVGRYEAGFFPAFWLPSGGRLVANFESFDTNYAALANLRSGAVRPLNPPVDGSDRGVGETGFLAASLSPDERTVLGCFGSVVLADPPMASVPMAGGEPTVLNEHFYTPSWSGVPTAGATPC